MGDSNLGRQFIEKSAELQAAETMRTDLEKIAKIAATRKLIYGRGMEAVKLDERIRSIDWWARATKIGTAIAIGAVTGAYVCALPAVATWLSTTSVVAWGTTTMGWSQGLSIALLARVPATLVVGGVVQTLTSGSGTAKGTSGLGLLFEQGYKSSYAAELDRIKGDVLGLSAARFVPAILMDDFQFIMDIEQAFRSEARRKGDDRGVIENAKTKACLDFWTKLETVAKDAAASSASKARIEQLKAEVVRLKVQLEAEAGKK